jgi:molybdate transport repressor ModE-like protein
MLDLKRLKVLGEVARRGSFSAAADALYLSQSAVSQQVATLEKEVGLPLLERTSNGPKLTDAGQALVGHADAAIARLEEAEQEVAAIAGLEGGELRIASFPTASAVLLTEALAEFSVTHPNVNLSVIEAEPEQSLPMLHAVDVDLAITFDYTTLPAATNERDVDRELLLTESMYVALPSRAPACRGRPGPACRSRRRGVGVRDASELVQPGGGRDVPRRRLRGPDRVRER